MSFISFPLVSVIVPCLNDADYIEECIKSILNQTYKNIELIVVDDGSTDGCDAIVRKLGIQYGFLFETQANKGLYSSINKGLSLIQGDYVCCFLPRDVMLLDRIEKQLDILESNPQAGACSGNMIAMDSDGEVLMDQLIIPSKEYTFDDVFLGNAECMPISTMMIRRSVLDVVGGYDPDVVLEDLYLWLKITHAGCTIIHSGDIYAYYRHQEVIPSSITRAVFVNELKIFSKYKFHGEYMKVRKKIIVRAFLKASLFDKALARELLFKFPACRHPFLFCKGFGQLLFCRG